jgi:TonB family protein
MSLTVTLALAAASPSSWAGLESGIDAYNGGDYAMAMHELKPLAEHRDAEAQLHVAMMYANGQGVLRDDIVAVVWYTNAALGGNSDAQIALGDMYVAGKGVPVDTSIGAYWHWRAAIGFAAKAKKNLEASLAKNAGQLAAPGTAASAGETGCVAPVYHADAQHFGDDASVDLMFLLDADGKVVDSAVAKSSTWPLLDKLARDAFASCSFPAAKHDGKAAPNLVKATYTWKTK